MMQARPLVFLCALSLVDCGGSGGSVSAGGGALPVIPNPPPTTSFAVSGNISTTNASCDGAAANCAPLGAASGFAVVIGAMPPGTVGSPIAPLYNSTTDSNGHFTVGSIPSGTYEIQVSKDATLAVMHAKLIVSNATSVTYTISNLSAGEQSWFTSINSYRTQNGAAPIAADEYAMEADRAYAEYLLANNTSICHPTCTNYPQFAQQYALAGGLFAYADTYRVSLTEVNCAAFAEQDAAQGPMLTAATARFAGYGFRGNGPFNAGACAFSTASN